MDSGVLLAAQVCRASARLEGEARPTGEENETQAHAEFEQRAVARWRAAAERTVHREAASGRGHPGDEEEALQLGGPGHQEEVSAPLCSRPFSMRALGWVPSPVSPGGACTAHLWGRETCGGASVGAAVTCPAPVSWGTPDKAWTLRAGRPSLSAAHPAKSSGELPLGPALLAWPPWQTSSSGAGPKSGAG